MLASNQSNTHEHVSPSSQSAASDTARRDGGRHEASARRPGAMTIIACVGKGGGGKTTTTINLAVIARLQGLKVGIVDADPQGSTYEWRCARASSDIPVVRCRPDQLNVLFNKARQAGAEGLFVDMPPDPTQALAVIRAADFILIPTRPTFLDLKVTWPYIELLRSVGRPYAVMINAAPPMRQGEDALMVRDARQALSAMTRRLWTRQITHRHAVAYAVTAGRGVAEIEPHGPADAEYRALWIALAHHTQMQDIA
jgi:chromosome partitioning protein